MRKAPYESAHSKESFKKNKFVDSHLIRSFESV